MTLDEEALTEIEDLADELADLHRQRKADLEAWSRLTTAGASTKGSPGQRLFERIARAGWASRKAEQRIAELLDGSPVVTA